MGADRCKTRAKKNTPRAIVDRMNVELRKALATEEVKRFMVQESLDAVSSTPEELATMFKRDIEKYAKVIAFANIRLD